MSSRPLRRFAATSAAAAALLIAACVPARAYTTERVLLVSIDGPRESETFGDPARANIPFLDALTRTDGVFSRAVKNTASTNTMPGHCALLTGCYEKLKNSALYAFGIRQPCPQPSQPTLFERLRKERGLPAGAAVLHSSKMKLAGLAYSTAPGYGEDFAAKNACGKWVLFGPGYSGDRPTFERALHEMRKGDPTLLVVHFAGPDVRGHAGDSTGYIAAIRESDGYVRELWQLAQELPAWRGKTTLIVSADHGRHLDGIQTGYKDHGCECEGCRAILFAAAGPDFVRGVEITVPRRQVDVAATVAELLRISRHGMEGEVMTELFVSP
ncbi:MAG: alkaline phosphatase family protein [bacterium]